MSDQISSDNGSEHSADVAGSRKKTRPLRVWPALLAALLMARVTLQNLREDSISALSLQVVSFPRHGSSSSSAGFGPLFCLRRFPEFAPATPLGWQGPSLKKHCYECHDADTQKAGLRLDNLAFDLSDQDHFKTWTKVFDKVRNGEMPPAKKPRPEKAELDVATKFLHDALHAASFARQQKRGRVIVRRLNRTEYENTVRQLVGTQVRVKEVLPEDDTASGFDTVSAALDLSATHFLIYQEAAEKAIASAVPVRLPGKMEETRTGRVISQKGSNFQQTLTRTCKLEGDSLIFYSRLPRYGLCCTPNVPMTGRYRIQMKACAVGGGGKPIPVGYLTFVNNDGSEPDLKEVHEIQPGEPKVYDFEFDLEARRPFICNLLSQANPTANKKKIDEYTGLGLRVDWLKIEGPVDTFPPPAYAKVFDGVPLQPRSVAVAIAGREKSRLSSASATNTPGLPTRSSRSLSIPRKMPTA